MTIPFFELASMHAEIRAELDRAWRGVSGSGAFIGGPYVERFEADWAAYCGTRHGVGVANGTAALQLTLEALGIGPGDEVVVPAATFVATAAAVAAAGARPVFVDVDPKTLLLTAGHLRTALTPRTAAVIPVHLYGQPADMDAIRRVADGAGIAVIEDAAQAHGARWRGARAGSLGHAACFSFYPGKNLGAFGDAGAVVTDDAGLAGRIRSLCNHGRAPDDRDRHDRCGRNDRLDGLQAAVLSVKLTRLEAWNAGRRRLAERYRHLLAGLPVEPVEVMPGAESSHHLVVVRPERRQAVRAALAAEGIGTAVHYPVPCHRQPAFAEPGTPRLPVAEDAAARVVSLPLFPHLADAAVDRVADALARALAAPKRGRRLAS